MQITILSVLLDRMLPTDCFLHICRKSLELSDIEQSFGKINGSFSQHLSWPHSRGHLKSSLDAAGGLAAGRGHGFNIAITQHLASVKILV